MTNNEFLYSVATEKESLYKRYRSLNLIGDDDAANDILEQYQILNNYYKIISIYVEKGVIQGDTQRL